MPFIVTKKETKKENIEMEKRNLRNGETVNFENVMAFYAELEKNDEEVPFSFPRKFRNLERRQDLDGLYKYCKSLDWLQKTGEEMEYLELKAAYTKALCVFQNMIDYNADDDIGGDLPGAIAGAYAYAMYSREELKAAALEVKAALLALKGNALFMSDHKAGFTEVWLGDLRLVGQYAECDLLF